MADRAWISGCRRACEPAIRLAPARNPLDFGLDDALDQPRQIVVEPGFQHRPQHLLDQILQRPRVVAEHGMGQRVEGGFDRRHRRVRQDRLPAAAVAALEGRRLVGGRPADRPRGGGLRRIRDRPAARPSGTTAAAADPAPPSRRSVRTPRLRFRLRRAISSLGEVASSRPVSSASISSWLLVARPARAECRPAAAALRGGGRRGAFDGGSLRRGNGRRRNVVHRRRLGCRRGGGRLLRLCRSCRRGGLVGAAAAWLRRRR